MNSAKKILCKNLVIALVVIVIQFNFTALFGYGIDPIVVDSVSLFLAIILALVTYFRTGRDRKIWLFFLPLIVVSSVPLLLLGTTLAAWSVGRFSP